LAHAANSSTTVSAGKWEIVHCWCALHDLLVEVSGSGQPQAEGGSESAADPQAPPSLRDFITQMYGAKEE